jgi:hypothetical protein
MALFDGLRARKDPLELRRNASEVRQTPLAPWRSLLAQRRFPSARCGFPLAPRFAERRLCLPHCRLAESHRRFSDVHCRPERRVGGPAKCICVSPQGIGAPPIPIAARKCSSEPRPSAFALRQFPSPARRFPLARGNARRSLGFPHCRLAHRHRRTKMPIGDAPISIADSPMAIGDAPIPIGGQKCSSGRRQSRSARLQAPLPRLPSPLPGGNAGRRDGNAFRRSSNRHFRGSQTHLRAEMLFAGTEMRFGKPAISMVTAPMGISKLQRPWPSPQ